jgi:hypothetical protein
MVGDYLKHVHDLSDEEVVAPWVENPYWRGDPLQPLAEEIALAAGC